MYFTVVNINFYKCLLQKPLLSQNFKAQSYKKSYKFAVRSFVNFDQEVLVERILVKVAPIDDPSSLVHTGPKLERELKKNWGFSYFNCDIFYPLIGFI